MVPFVFYSIVIAAASAYEEDYTWPDSREDRSAVKIHVGDRRKRAIENGLVELDVDYAPGDFVGDIAGSCLSTFLIKLIDYIGDSIRGCISRKRKEKGLKGEKGDDDDAPYIKKEDAEKDKKEEDKDKKTVTVTISKKEIPPTPRKGDIYQRPVGVEELDKELAKEGKGAVPPIDKISHFPPAMPPKEDIHKKPIREEEMDKHRDDGVAKGGPGMPPIVIVPADAPKSPSVIDGYDKGAKIEDMDRHRDDGVAKGGRDLPPIDIISDFPPAMPPKEDIHKKPIREEEMDKHRDDGVAKGGPGMPPIVIVPADAPKSPSVIDGYDKGAKIEDMDRHRDDGVAKGGRDLPPIDIISDFPPAMPPKEDIHKKPIREEDMGGKEGKREDDIPSIEEEEFDLIIVGDEPDKLMQFLPSHKGDCPLGSKKSLRGHCIKGAYSA
ncbi:uncharacterized protein BBOV_IV005950 [Babesia bovis T2Bo]|uniref:Membrane protein, putative n=1 Tax=Babesia bovis TaxID=5865 RepID=A7AQY7_BABBO|nr:uncharacterized protein BBOV_IV005950 [Babesia bovis T2Bo]EDO06956.1 hypothetical protein BBOV_IV005950 [Babesia bovis T2Bo]|eukprot:XP_001610524.1 hypothetical protein [Babesia bovis T2Bo]